MEELKLIEQALDLANQKGVFALQDSHAIVNALGSIAEKLGELEKLKQQAEKQPKKAK